MSVKRFGWPFIILAGGALLGLFLWWQSQPEPVAPPAPLVAVAPPAIATVPAPSVPPAVHLQLDAAPATPLPALDSSDANLLKDLGRGEWSALLQHERLVRRIVATIDNLPRAEAPVTMWPVKPAEGWLVTRQTSAGVVLAPENEARYDKHVAMLGRLPVERVVTLYLRYYPLFQQAYEQLGHPGAYFHDRLRIAIEDLLATPEPAAPLLLAPDNVRYRFADPDFARRSAGQKILLRMGVAHARVVKAWLTEFRQALARHERPIPPVERKSNP